ncbi:hypothetical protein FSARC_3604, partial [Fusarium sarcochroum]
MPANTGGKANATREDPLLCVVGDKFPQFCDKRFPDIEKHNSSNLKLLDVNKADHATFCAGTPSQENKERRDRCYIMSEDQYARFQSWGWRQTAVPTRLNEIGSKEATAQRSWRQIRETIFPSFDRAEEEFGMTRPDSSSVFTMEEKNIALYLPFHNMPAFIPPFEPEPINPFMFESDNHLSDYSYHSPQTSSRDKDASISWDSAYGSNPSTMTEEDLVPISDSVPDFMTLNGDRKENPYGLNSEYSLGFNAALTPVYPPISDFPGCGQIPYPEVDEPFFDGTHPRNSTADSLKSLEEALPSLLQIFFLRLHSPSSIIPHVEMRNFITVHGWEIESRFYKAVKDIRDQELLPESQKQAVAKIDIDQWLRDLGAKEFEIGNSVAYKWLMAALLKTLTLAPVECHDMCSHIQRVVPESLERCGPISSWVVSKCYKMTLSSSWDPTAFLREQFGRSSDLGRLLGESLTLTGSITDAQVLPCAEYLLQTWPTIGGTLLELLKAALVTNNEVYGELEDQTIIRCQFVNSKLEAQVEGNVDSIAAVCELLGWLGAALRPSCLMSGLAICRPQILISRPVRGSLRCDFEYHVTPVSLTPQDPQNGRCWHAIFQNPVIVAGYPIPRRKRHDSGLEAPLNIMSGLTMSPRTHKYMGHHFLKGFSTALVPVEKLDDMILWHLYYSEDGSRLPYPDLDGMKHTGLDLRDLTAGRHVVGWCSQARFFAGAPDMNYAIKTSQLERPGREFALEKVSLSIGQLVTGGCQFAIGRKDCHVRITRGSYKAKLQWLDQKYVTLWDVVEERGWLVNGTAALLHLLRASLAHSKADKFKSEFLFQEDQFQESQNPGSIESVLDVLLSHANQKLELYSKDDYTFQETKLSSNGQLETVTKTLVSSTTIKDRVEELYETLEKLFDHNATSEASYKGINAKPRIKDYLEGWDFTDIATDRDPFFLRRAKLPISLLGWVDFTRAIPAITLFGKGFGDIIRASETQPNNRLMACSAWNSVPKNRNLLCVSIADLREIIDRIGDQATNPITVAPGILWSNPDMTNPFHGNCSCDPKGKSSRNPIHHAVQKLVSSKLRPFVSNFMVDLDSHQNGAVIFGSLERALPWSSSAVSGSSEGESSSSVPQGNSDTSHQPDTSNFSSQSPYTSASFVTEFQDTSASGASPDDGAAVSHGTPAVDQASVSQVSSVGDQT